MDFFLRAVLRRVVFLAAGLRADVRFFAVDLRAVDFRFAVVFLLLAVDFRPVDFLAADLRRVVFLAVVFLAAVFRFAVDLRRVDFFAVDLRAAVFLLAVDFFLAGDIGHPLSAVSGRHALQASPFPFAHPSPHPVSLVTSERVVEALDADGTVSADPLGLPR